MTKLTEDEVRDALIGFHKMLVVEADDPKMVADAMLTVATVAKAQAYGVIDTGRHLWMFALDLLKQPKAHEEAAALEEAQHLCRGKLN